MCGLPFPSLCYSRRSLGWRILRSESCSCCEMRPLWKMFWTLSIWRTAQSLLRAKGNHERSRSSVLRVVLEACLVQQGIMPLWEVPVSSVFCIHGVTEGFLINLEAFLVPKGITSKVWCTELDCTLHSLTVWHKAHTQQDTLFWRELCAVNRQKFSSYTIGYEL